VPADALVERLLPVARAVRDGAAADDAPDEAAVAALVRDARRELGVALVSAGFKARARDSDGSA
jgi:hypothetical protein